MQIFRIVKGGFVDKVIGFNSLPKSILTGIKKGTTAGFPRHWKTWFETEAIDEHAKKGELNPFYILDYIAINADKEKWQEINSYVRRTVDPSFRLLDKLEDMCIPLAADPRTELNIDPENIAIIPIPEEKSDEVPEVSNASDLKDLIKKKGRPRRIKAEVKQEPVAV